MRSLYDSDFRYTPDAINLAGKVGDFLAHQMNEFVAKGYSPREVAHVMQGAILEVECETILSKPQAVLSESGREK